MSSGMIMHLPKLDGRSHREELFGTRGGSGRLRHLYDR